MSRHSPKEIQRIKRIAAGADFGKPIAQGSLAAPTRLGARPNLALSVSTTEWSERYRRALRQLCKTADDEALNPDNSIAMQSRMLGESPEATARCVADEIMAWANESAPNETGQARRENH